MPSILKPSGPPTVEQEPEQGKDKISHFHYIVPASKPNIELCLNLASSAANRYPVPSILGYNGTGQFDAAVTHLAKLRAIERYLNALKPEEDDDLIAIVDGYDVLMQLPPEIMIERYFDARYKAEAELAERFGLTVPEANAQGLRQSVIWGPDKICWPIVWSEPRCWAVPHSNLPPKAFGPKTGNGEMIFMDPRWLNSGTVIGPIDDVRALIAATMAEIKETYDEEYQWKESDQFYISNIWGRQEYYRSLAIANGKEEDVQGGGSDRHLPDEKYAKKQTDYHIAIDYESSMFQTKAGYEPWFGYLEFNNSGLNANMTMDLFEEGDDFNPYDIEMPASVYAALDRLYDSIPEAHPGSVTADWIRTINLGVNYVTRHIFPLWHCTGAKEWVQLEYPRMWYYPFAKSLMKASVKAIQGGELISNHLIDGRKWAPRNVYPSKEELNDELGGAWTDFNGGQFVEWRNLCGEHYEQLFGGESFSQTKNETSSS